MINVLKSVLQDGMEIEKVKEMANEYKVTLKYKGMTGNCSVSKMCSPGCEKAVCMKSIDTAISGMYINTNNLAEAKAWLDGERWNTKKDKINVELTEKEIRVISVSLRQHWNKMVDDNGNAKKEDSQAFADLCYQTSNKFEKLDIIDKSFEELND